jgi:hypothetical protein
MTPEQLQEGANWIIGEFYSKKRIANRVVSNIFNRRILSTLFLTLPVNISYHIDAKRWGIMSELPSKQYPHPLTQQV